MMRSSSALFSFFFISIVSFFLSLNAQQTVNQYDIFELKLEASVSGNPFLVVFDATFKFNGDSTESRYSTAVVPGFYDGKTFNIRFSPDAVGTWTYSTSSNISSLNGKSGSISVVSSNKHGGIMVDPKNKHHFIYEDGTRYFLMGYECDWCWALGLKGVDSGNVTLDGFIEMTTSYGFNHFLVQIYANESGWGKKVSAPPRVAPTKLCPWAGGYENPDYTKFDTDYMDHYDLFLQTLKKYGAIAHIMVTVWNKAVVWPAHDSLEDKLYWRYVAARFGAYSNVVWDVSKEANREGGEYWETIFPLLASVNPHKRLITSHTRCFNWTYCDFATLQEHSNYYDNIINHRREHDAPIANCEWEYEDGPIPTYGHHSTALEMLPTLWDLYLAGGYQAWYFIDSAWDVITGDQTPGYHYCKYLYDFFQGVEYWLMDPHDEVIEIPSNSTIHCLANIGKEYVIHGHDKSPFTVTLSNVDIPLSAMWLDPQTNEKYSVEGTFQNGKHTMTPPTKITKNTILHLY